MTEEELIFYYRSLLIIQYNDKPKAIATIEALAEVGIMNLLPLDLYSAFDLDTAVGDQLDIIGKYVGVSRYGRTFENSITLSDADFRSLIRMATMKNYSFSSLYDIQYLINTFFMGDLLVFDFKNMSMGYLFNSVIGTRNLAEMFIVNNLLPKPMGVQLASLIYANDITSFFGFINYEQPIAINNTGFNDYDDYQMDHPWLNYSDAIIV
jgi:hypothetical protein